jgi:Leucine-rich repeat (LRR) protein
MEDYPNSFLYLFKSKELYPESKDVRKLYDEIIVSYNNIIYQKEGIFAIKEMNFNEGRIELENKEINLFEEIYSLDVTRYWLKFLNLSNNQIEEISCLDNFQNLFSLNLANNNLEKISGLETAPRIGMLNLEKNNISKIEGLEKLTGLRYLYLSYNDISKIEGLEKNTRLATLYLYDNNISKIEGLDNLKQLEIIRLSRNKIELINGLSNFNYLKEIDLSDNLLTSMKEFGKIDSLKRLNLSNNQLTTIDSLENFENLEYLNLRDNPGLPEFFAILYSNKVSINKIREYSGLPHKELKEMAIKLEEAMPKKPVVDWEKVEARKKEQRIKEAFEGSDKTTDYGLKHKLRERMNALLKLNKPGVCLYCNNNIPEDVNFAEECENTINRFVKKLNLPRKAKDKTKPYRSKHKTAVQQWGVRVGLDGYITNVIETKMRNLHGHYKSLVNNFTKDHFPKLLGIVCKECSDEFIQKTTKFFKKLNSHKYKFTDFVQNIWKSMKQCHEDYMKLYESFIKKRGF